MKAIERHRQSWQGKSDEWLFERLDNELKQKVEEIHRLLAENETLRQFDVIRLKAFADYAQKRIWEDCDKDLSEFVDEFLSF
jgi:16S rRNA C967 or C1407 C5-methylase (RsmB/RsmF family)